MLARQLPLISQRQQFVGPGVAMLVDRVTKAGQRLFGSPYRLQLAIGHVVQRKPLVTRLRQQLNQQMACRLRRTQNDRTATEQAGRNSALDGVWRRRQRHTSRLHRRHQPMLGDGDQRRVGRAHQLLGRLGAGQQEQEIRSEGLLPDHIAAEVLPAHDDAVDFNLRHMGGPGRGESGRYRCCCGGCHVREFDDV